MTFGVFNVFRPLEPFSGAVGLSLAQKIAALFKNNEQGALYDPSDLPTLYTQRTGTLTTQSTVGGPVGTMLDKSGRGNHAAAPSDAARPLLGREPEGGRRNLLLNTDLVSGGAAQSGASTDVVTEVTSPFGTASTRLVQLSDDSASRYQQVNAFSIVDGVRYTLSVYLKRKSGAQSVIFQINNFASPPFGPVININLVTGVAVAPISGTTVSVEDVGDGWYRVSTSRVSNFTGNCGWQIIVTGASQAISLYAAGIQMEEVATTPTPYQRVGATALDVTEAGKRELYYLQFNGSTTVLQVNQAFLRSGDGNLIVVGVRGAAQSDRRIVAEGSSVSDNPIYSPIQSGVSANNSRYNSYMRGAGAVILGNTGDGPIVFNGSVAVISAIDTKSSLNARINGGLFFQRPYTDETIATDRFAVGALVRATVVSFFDGRIYGVVARAKLSTENELGATEKYVAQKTGVTLP